ncbi:hypothetical protein [Marinicella rhabdoformis]|uniref:hypothetical protein n=1 Tax=Marinicella rhabdoformis TaxID=2580566 RepID=UPI0012AED3C7|nr:hypothetical protein [Marinicella rhabdoformis]
MSVRGEDNKAFNLYFDITIQMEMAMILHAGVISFHYLLNMPLIIKTVFAKKGKVILIKVG